MLGGRAAPRILLAVALVALPLMGLAVLAAGGSGTQPASPRDAVLRLAPGQSSDAQAVRSGPGAEPGARSGRPDARGPVLLAVLLGVAAAIALAATSCAPPPLVASVRTGRHLPAAGRGPPFRSSR
jgi:hypothetical protein